MPGPKSTIPSFDDSIETVDRIIDFYKYRWQLKAVTYVDWSDIAQELRIHIWKKWHLLKEGQSIEGYIATTVQNQIFNKLRDHYYSKTKPCIGNAQTKYKPCPFARPDDGCGFTPSGKQCAECKVYAIWQKRREPAFQVKLPLPMAHHEQEVHNQPSDDIPYEAHFKLINKHVRRYLNKLEYKIYRMLYVKKQTEEDVAKMLGLKTSEKYRISGYRQINTYKARIMEKIKKMLEVEDILGR